MLPKNWMLATVGKACNIQNNLRLPINSDERKTLSGQYPYFGPTGILDYINEYKIDQEFALIGEDGDHFLKFKEKEMTLLYSGKANVNNHAHIITSSNICLAKWFYLYFMHQDITSHLTRQGAKRYKLTKAALEKLPILLPQLPEQKKIAQILSTWDKAITTTEQLLANSQQQKKALMQQLLTGKKRFLGFGEKWQQYCFNEVLDIVIGGTPSRANSEYWDDKKNTQNRWLSIADLKNKVVGDTSEYITDLGVKKSNVKLVKAGTIVMSFKLTIGRCAILTNDMYTNEAICALQIKNMQQLKNEYLYQALSLIDFDQEIDQAVKGKTLNKEKLKRLKIVLPSLEEQEKIASVLSSADQEIETLEQKLDYLKQEKKALMQELLTGKRRVKVEELK